MTNMLKLVSKSAFSYCWPWHLRFLENGQTIGGVCVFCERDIAVPIQQKHKSHGCIYCGLDNGELPLTEKPFD